MWKRLDEDICDSRKMARVTLEAIALWTYIMPCSDSKGRYPADAAVILKRCMTHREDLTVLQVQGLLDELVEKRLFHRYAADGEYFIVAHDMHAFNPPGALRYTSARYPDPPPTLCECLRGEAAAKPGPSAPPADFGIPSQQGEDAVVNMLVKERKCPNAVPTITRYVVALFERGLVQQARDWAANPANNGRDALAMHDEITKKFEKAKPTAKAPTVCPVCLHAARRDGRYMKRVDGVLQPCECNGVKVKA